MRHVKVKAVSGGMSEFHGCTGVAEKEGRFWRVFLDNPVFVKNVGWVKNDLWEGRHLKTVKE